MTSAQLCHDCGLCCDGALFSSVSLEPAGVLAARAHGLPVVQTLEAFQVDLPCAALHGVFCSIYDERPECCADFSCALADRVNQGTLSLDKARGIIDKTRARRSRVTAVVGATPWWLAHRSALEAEYTNPRWALDNAQFLSDLKALNNAIVRHFWGDSAT
jgi:uncharacterized protein